MIDFILKAILWLVLGECGILALFLLLFAGYQFLDMRHPEHRGNPVDTPFLWIFSVLAAFEIIKFIILFKILY